MGVFGVSGGEEDIRGVERKEGNAVARPASPGGDGQDVPILEPADELGEGGADGGAVPPLLGPGGVEGLTGSG
jgi:hypothetical protein